MLANLFDYALDVCQIDVSLFSDIFVNSKEAKQIEDGNPACLSGKSGEDIAKSILTNAMPEMELPENVPSFERTPAYWCGYYLSYYQWYTARRFKDIFNKVSLNEIISMYAIYHEMDIMRFVESLEERYLSIKETNLKLIREKNGLSQSKLAKMSGINLRSIQLYEQRVNDIDKAQAKTIYRLAKALNCEIEDILENPLSED